MTACANSAEDGPCNAQEASDAAPGLAYLAAAEADPTMHIGIKFKPLQGSPFGVEALSDFDRVVYLDPGNESAFGRDRDKAAAAAADSTRRNRFALKKVGSSSCVP